MTNYRPDSLEISAIFTARKVKNLKSIINATVFTVPSVSPVSELANEGVRYPTTKDVLGMTLNCI